MEQFEIVYESLVNGQRAQAERQFFDLDHQVFTALKKCCPVVNRRY